MAGRELPPSSPFAGDDGSAAPAVAAALAAVADGTGTVAQVVAALAGTRVLVPVLAELEPDDATAPAAEDHPHETPARDVPPAGPPVLHAEEKAASAGIVALRAPDGRTALPVFSSVATMARWRPDARPVPSDIARAALSAVTEGWELLVVDPGGPVTVLVPRPAVWALAQGQPWERAVTETPAGRVVDPDVRAAVRAAVLGVLPAGEGAGRRWGRLRRASGAAGTAPALVRLDVRPGDRAEVAVELTLAPGLDRSALDAASALVGSALAADETVTRRVDSLELRFREP